MKEKMISLRTGTLIVPQDYIIYTLKNSPDPDYAAVLADKEGKCDHYVILSAGPLNSLNEKEEDLVIRGVCDEFSELKSVICSEIPLDERLANGNDMEKWAASIRLGLFSIPDVEKSELWHGCGIIRKDLKYDKK